MSDWFIIFIIIIILCLNINKILWSCMSKARKSIWKLHNNGFKYFSKQNIKFYIKVILFVNCSLLFYPQTFQPFSSSPDITDRSIITFNSASSFGDVVTSVTALKQKLESLCEVEMQSVSVQGKVQQIQKCVNIK